MEFGQIPKQVFKLPHPKRSVAADLIGNETWLSVRKSTLQGIHMFTLFAMYLIQLTKYIININQYIIKTFTASKSTNITLKNPIIFQSHKEAVSAVRIIIDEKEGENIVSIGRDGIMKIYSLQSEKLIRSIVLSSVSLCSCTSYQTPSNSNVLVVGSWDNSLYVRMINNISYNFLKLVFVS